MTKGRVRAAVCFLFGVFLLLATVQFLPAAEIGPRLQEQLTVAPSTNKIPVIVRLAGSLRVQTLAVSPTARGPVRAQARAALIRALKEQAKTSQQPIRDLLRQRGIPEPKDLWLINGLALDASPALIEELSRRPEVASISFDEVLHVPRVVKAADTNQNAVEDNIDVVNAPALWNSGFTGQGVTVAIVDSGVDVQHADLAPRWRGGTNSWFNAVAANCSNSQVTCATSCDTDTTEPCDYLDAQNVAHGTGVAGVLVGGSATGTAIGVAPGAKWIAAKIFDSSDNAPLSLIHQAFAWLLDPDGNPDTDDAPDVVNNSWALESAINQCNTEFQPDVQAFLDAGIAVVFPAGNSGPNAGTSVSPANYANAFAVGSVGTGSPSDIDFSLVSSFSARGPSACDGTTYPETVAPGYFIKTADQTFDGTVPNAVQTLSGTSFSAPEAAGVMALLLSAFPGTSVADLENAIMRSALDLGSPGPDNDYGYGRIDALAAFDYLNGSPNIEVTDSIDPATDGILAFGAVAPNTTASGTVRIRNAGSAPLTLGTIDLSRIAAPFSVAEDPCSNAVLSPDQACVLTFNFSPTTFGTFSGSLNIPSDDPDQSSVGITLNGLGDTPPVPPQPVAPANKAAVSNPVTFSWIPASDADGDGVSQSLVVSAHADFTAAETFPVDPVPPVAPLVLGAGGLLLAWVGLSFGRRRRWALLLAAGLLLFLAACGGGGSSGGGTPANTQSTTLDGFTSGVTYYWKMTARDSRGAETESAVRTFTVQ